MDDVIKSIKQYCLDRLNEADELNKSNTLTAFSCYAWLIAVLSHLAYAGQVSKDAKYCSDAQCYKQFVGSFMPDYDSTIMYENFRCGLIHACSLDPTWKGDENDGIPATATKLFLTHNEKYAKGKGPIKVVQLRGVKSQIIYHKDLSNSIRAAIENMFNKKEICESAKKATTHQRLVTGLSEVPQQIARKFQLQESEKCAESAQLSGFYDP